MSNPTTKTTTSSEEFTTVPIHNEDTTTAAAAGAASNTANDMQAKEKVPDRMMRTTKNAWRRAVGCCKKSTPLTKIRIKEHQMAKRKKEFGVQYMDMVQRQASEEQLQQAVQACLKDIEGIMQEIVELENKIEQVSEETKSKIKAQPTAAANHQYANNTNSGLYSGGDPSIEVTDDDDEENAKNAPPQGAGAFSITSADEEEDEDDLAKESWLPPPPTSAPPAVPADEGKPSV